MNEHGCCLWCGKALTDPEAITQILRQHGSNLRVWIEIGPLMPWLVQELLAASWRWSVSMPVMPKPLWLRSSTRMAAAMPKAGFRLFERAGTVGPM